jgi:hypothetical protein
MKAKLEKERSDFLVKTSLVSALLAASVLKAVKKDQHHSPFVPPNKWGEQWP